MIRSSFLKGLPFGISSLGKRRLRFSIVYAASSWEFLKNVTGLPLAMAFKNWGMFT